MISDLVSQRSEDEVKQAHDEKRWWSFTDDPVSDEIRSKRLKRESAIGKMREKRKEKESERVGYI
jgi:hypothetical protein